MSVVSILVSRCVGGLDMVYVTINALLILYVANKCDIPVKGIGILVNAVWMVVV